MSSRKFVLASQTRNIIVFKNLKRKVLKCCANIYFNKQCLLHGLTPTYANIRVPRTSLAASFTQRKLIKMRLKDEIKFLYAKKTELNKQLYRMHLTIANEWDKGAQILFMSIHDALTMKLQHKYKRLDKKMEKLKTTQTQNNSNYPLQEFYPRVINNTTIDFTPNELALLNKGMKYNLHYKQKQWITTFALEAETAISHLPLPEQEPVRYQINRNIQHLFNTVGK